MSYALVHTYIMWNENFIYLFDKTKEMLLIEKDLQSDI